MCASTSSAISDWVGALSALAALATAIIMYRALKNDTSQRRQEIMPWLTLGGTAAVGYEEDKGYRVNLFFRDVGKGPGHLNAVDLDQPNIEAQISTPTGFGPNGVATVTVWLHECNQPYTFRIRLYYWNLEKHCYCTEARVKLWYNINAKGEVKTEFFLPKEEGFYLGEIASPKETVHWKGNRDLFVKQEWIVDPGSDI
jgi:hypothetical protein